MTGIIQQELADAISKFVAYEFLAGNNAEKNLQERLTQLNIDVVFMDDTSNNRFGVENYRENIKADVIVLHKANLYESLYQEDNLSAASHQVTVYSNHENPLYNVKSTYKVEPIKSEREKLIELMEKYKVIEKKDHLHYDKIKKNFIDEKADIDFIQHAKIYIDEKYQDEAKAEILTLLQSPAFSQVKAVSINFSEGFILPEKLGQAMPENVVELNINPQPYFFNELGEIVTTKTEQMPAFCPHIKHLQVANAENIDIKGIEQWQGLTSLKLHQSNFVHMHEITKLNKLEMLTLSGCNLTRVPIELVTMPRLEYLDLSHNHIQTLPYELSWSGMHSIKLNNNQIKEIDNLPYQTLTYVDVSNNLVEELPKKLIGFLLVNDMFNPKEQHIKLAGNQLDIEKNKALIEALLSIHQGKKVNDLLELDKQLSQMPKESIIKTIEAFREEKKMSQVQIKM